jgi:hypothetical protein
MGWYGAIVAPHSVQENFIEVMVNIDGIDRAAGIPLVAMMMPQLPTLERPCCSKASDPYFPLLSASVTGSVCAAQ